MRTRLSSQTFLLITHFRTLMTAVLMVLVCASVPSWAQGNALTVTVLTSSLNPSFTGNNVTITATVTSNGSPVTLGAVSFFEGAQALATNVPLNASGQATFSKANWPEGSHVVTANYSGATGFSASTTNFTQTVNNATTVTGTSFCNSQSGITINDNAAATPYPSRIFVSGLVGTVQKVTISINNLTHSAPDDINLMLVSPTGQKFIFMSDVGGTNAVSGLNLILDSTSPSALPDATDLSTGTFRPTDFEVGTDVFPAPAPAGPYTSASVASLGSLFNGTNPNGEWQLYVVDDNASATGSIGSWCLNFTMTCPTTTAYVKAAVASSGDGTTWGTAFKTLQEALTAANNCASITQIWVAKGTYYPDEGGSFANNDRNASFTMKNGVAIYGGFVGNEASDYDLSLRNFTTNETILSGDIDKDNTVDADNAYHVIFNNFTSGTPLTSSAVLDGFLIMDGYANGSAPNSSGAGMYNNYASPIVRNCTFFRNTIVGTCFGGGMYNANSSPEVLNCTFEANIGNSPTSSGRIHGIGMYNNASSPTITNCAFTNNTANDGDHYSYGGGIENENSSPVISGCTFTNHTTTFGPGIFNRTSPLNISNCTFTNNQVYTNPGGVNGSGINTRSSTGTITNCRFVNNEGFGSISVEDVALVEITRCSFSGNRYGITLLDASPNISNCLFTGNRFGGVTAALGGASTPVVTNCTFSENPESGLGSISNYGDNSPILKNCILWGSGKSVYVFGSKPQPTITHSIVKQASGVYTGTGNLNIDPLFVNAADPDGADNVLGTADDGLRLQACSPAINAGTNTGAPATDILGNARPFVGTVSVADMGAFEYQGTPPSILYVNAAVTSSGDGTTWGTAFKTLQEALQLSCPSVTQIWVAIGTYYPTADATGNLSPANARTKTFVMKNNLAIYGGFPNDGTGSMANRNWTTNPTILSGEIQQDNDASNNSFHVILNYQTSLTSTAVLDGFTITGGDMPYDIGGSWGGGMLNFESSPSLSNITFSGNSARFGGGMFNHNSTPSLSNVTFSGNSAEFGGGIFSEASIAGASLSKVTFLGNSAIKGGGMFNTGTSPSLTNCSFLGNVAEDGGGMYNRFSSPSLTNCTFSGNQAPLGGGIYNETNTSPSFKNCILWGNSSEVGNLTNNSPTYTNCLVQGLNPAGTGNLDGTNAANNPLFVNQPPVGLGTTGNLRLQACSPAINAGTNTGAPATDILGNARVGATDMGAYEYQGTPLSTATIIGGGTVCQFGSSPEVNFTGFDGTKPYTFTYTINNGNSQTASTTGNSAIATVSHPTGTSGNFTYTLIKVSDANGCEVSISTNNTAPVSITANPAQTASSNAPLCVGSQLNLGVSGGTAWTWSGPNSFSNNTQNPSRPSATTAMSGVYSVTVSTANGCTQVATTQVVVGQVTNPQVSSNSPVCAGSSIRLSVTGAGAGTTYSWGASSVFSSTLQNPTRPNATVAMSGTYSVTITGGCSSAVLTTSVVVSPNVAPSITALRVNGNLPNAQNNTVAVCNTAPVTLTVAATNAVTYSWRGPTGAGSGFTSSLVSPVNMPISTPRQGQYTVTVRNGCTVFNQRVINIQLINCATRLASAEDAEAVEMEINAYPNPVSKTLTVEVRLKEAQPLQLKLLNSVGQTSGQWSLNEPSNYHKTELNLSDLTGGVYLLEAQAGQQRAVKRVVKIQYE